MPMYLQKVISRRLVTKNIAGSGSISQMHESADPDPDPHQNVMYPQCWREGRSRSLPPLEAEANPA
jgi:hypothetical protein